MDVWLESLNFKTELLYTQKHEDTGSFFLSRNLITDLLTLSDYLINIYVLYVIIPGTYHNAFPFTWQLI